MGLQIFINNTEIDLKDEFPLSFNAQINDIREPEKRTTTYTKTITIPASKTNRDLFTYIFDIHTVVDTSGTVNYTPDFNPNLKADTLVLFDGVEVFNGIAQLTDIHIIDNDNIEFDVVLVGQLVNLFANIGDSYLTDLDFSEYDHDYTRANIEASWTNTSGYVYPMIDYGLNNNIDNFRVDNMYPAIFVKDYIDKIFSDAGAVYESNFFDSAFFGNLIIPFNSADFKITDAEITSRKFRASTTADIQYTAVNTITNTTVLWNDDSTPPNFDNSSQYATGTGIFTVGTGLQGIYNFGFSGDITGRFVPDTSGVAMKTTRALVANITFVKVDALGNATLLNSAQKRIRTLDFDITTDYETDPTLQDDYAAGFDGNLTFQSGAVSLVATDTIFVRINYYHSAYTLDGALVSNGLGSGVGGSWASDELFIDASNNIYDGAYYVKIKQDAYFYNEIASANYVEGDSINMNNAIPKNIKQKDFLSSIIKLFNLYLEQDKDISSKFIIEPRDDYYYSTISSSTYLDLSDKLDISQSLDVTPMGNLDAKSYFFKYKDDKDYFNTDYFNRWGETYSEREVVVSNDFIKDNKTIEVIFSATPSVGNTSNDRVIPRILNFDTNGDAQPVSANIRILYWDGLKSTNTVWTIEDSNGLTQYTTYPYAGMVDDPYDPTVSLDWEVPDEIYWTNIFSTINYTNQNLYNVYYKKFIDEITDRNSKIVKGWFDISPYDYSRLDFRKLYYFEGEYFRLNKVIDYNPISNRLTQLEFVKIKEGVTTSYDITEATDVFQTDKAPRFSTPFTLSRNLQPIGVNISGSGNRVPDSASGVSIVGIDNAVGEWCSHVNITGEDNGIGSYSSGVVIIGDGNKVVGSNIALINTYNKTINISNTTYIQGVAVGGEGSVELVTSNKTRGTSGNDDATVYLVDCTSGDITFTLPAAADFPMGIPLHFKKIDNTANSLTIDGNGSETIDGDTTLIITDQYDAPAIITDGANWWII